MKKIIFLLLTVLVASCSIDREPQTVVIEGIDGVSTLIVVNEEPQGDNCENGGQRFTVGTDQNADGVLQTEEETGTYFVCNGRDGRDGQSNLINIIPVEGNEECPNGGVEVQKGFDINGNGALDQEEVDFSTFICNGGNGADGEDGEDGFTALVNTITIEEGELCKEGGFLFQSGLDTNRNGLLDQEEITSEETVCNGVDGLNVVYSTTSVEESENCPFGGLIIQAGLDANENGELDQNEVATTDYICNGADGQDGEDGFNSLTVTEQVEGGYVIKTGLDINRNNILEDSEVINTATVFDGQDGADGADGEDGADGQDGFNSLISLDEIQPSTTFPNGGVQISSGLDSNRNNLLDDSEISNIAFIANGTNGQNGQDGADGEDGADGQDGANGLSSLINILQNTPNATSTTVQTGIDTNNNGVLEDSEVTQEFVVEDGVDGADGQDGQDGSDGEDGQDGQDGADGSDGLDGKCSFILVVEEPAGENCEFGGVKITTGKDDNRNFIFDDNEIDNTEYVCEYRPCVEVVEVTTVLDFEIFNEGDFVSSYGDISVYGYNSRFNHNKAMIFDSDADTPTGNDWDLLVDSGNILIISEDGDSNDPDDNYAGGVFTFCFSKDVTFTAIDIIDIVGSHNKIKFYDANGSRLDKQNLTPSGSTASVTMNFNISGVRTVVVEICESGALDNLTFKCLQVINNCE